MARPRISRELQRRSLIAGAAATVLSPAIVRAQGQTSGVALVIGNSKYRWEASLPNVKRDAPDIARAFQGLGLRTELLQDANRDAMHRAIAKFATESRGANLAAFYFAGHGASWEKDTYLVPEDADLANPNNVQSFVSAGAINEASRQARHRLLVFDNCRNNPSDGWRQRAAVISSSVARAELAAHALNGPNTLVLFSTAPGRVALDGPPGEHSPFAAARRSARTPGEAAPRTSHCDGGPPGTVGPEYLRSAIPALGFAVTSRGSSPANGGTIEIGRAHV